MNWEEYAGSWPLAAHSRFIACPPHRWHVQELGPENAPMILLIHGAGGGTQSWRHLAPMLAERYRVVAIDLPGQGFTALGDPQRCGLTAMSEDLLTLCGQQGWHLSTIIGHSAGAAIALQIALHLTPAPRVISLNGALGSFKGIAGFLFPLMAKALAMTPWVARIFTASTSRPGSVERLIAGTGSTLPEDELEWYRALISSPSHVDATLNMMAQWNLDPLRKSLPAHPAPTLLIAADKDRTVPASVSQQVAAEMPNSRVLIIPDLGHLAHEEDAGTVFEAMASFLSSA
ncbi:MAG: alpha/beta fold hydrolase BchO [Pseudomonadota bacterium]